MPDVADVPVRLVDVLAKQMYARSMRRRPDAAGWYDLTKAQRKIWLEDARVALEPIYREIADDLERRMMNVESIQKATQAFHSYGLHGTQPIEEAITAAFRHAVMSVAPSRRTVEQAVVRFARAVREIGGDLDGASARIGPGELALRAAGLAEDKARDLAVGVAIGMLMAADSEAEAALVAIAEDEAMAEDLAA